MILTYDASVSGRMWLMADYLPEVAALDRRIFPSPEGLADWLGGAVEVQPVPIPRDTSDWMLGSFWAHPERVLDERARANTSGFARMPAAVVQRVVSVAAAATSRTAAGTRATASCATLDEHDVGLRLIVARRAG